MDGIPSNILPEVFKRFTVPHFQSCVSWHRRTIIIWSSVVECALMRCDMRILYTHTIHKRFSQCCESVKSENDNIIVHPTAIRFRKNSYNSIKL